MSIKYKLDIIGMLKESGFSTYKLSKEKIISSGTIQNIRNGNAPSGEVLNIICKLTGLQPGDILEYIPDNTEE